MPQLSSEVVPFLYAPRLFALGGDSRNKMFWLSDPQGASSYPRFYNDRWDNLQKHLTRHSAKQKMLTWRTFNFNGNFMVTIKLTNTK